MPQPRDSHEGVSYADIRTVLTAVVANVLVAIAKSAAAVLTGSAALAAEALHSIADTGNELLLFIGVHRSKKREDEEHPFGYGQERFFWAFLAALGLFLIGGVLSIGEGIRSLLQPEPLTSPWIGIGVLVAVAFFEGYSWWVARKQLLGRARELDRSLVEHLARASDPTVSAVYLEDSAALIGITVALVALILQRLTGWYAWDGLASICIGLLLIVVAVLLARRSKALLVDESAPRDVVEPIREIVVRPGWVAGLRALDVVFVGPAQVLVAARVVPTSHTSEGSARELIRNIDLLRQELLGEPIITEVAITVEPAESNGSGIT